MDSLRNHHHHLHSGISCVQVKHDIVTKCVSLLWAALRFHIAVTTTSDTWRPFVIRKPFSADCIALCHHERDVIVSWAALSLTLQQPPWAVSSNADRCSSAVCLVSIGIITAQSEHWPSSVWSERWQRWHGDPVRRYARLILSTLHITNAPGVQNFTRWLRLNSLTL